MIQKTEIRASVVKKLYVVCTKYQPLVSINGFDSPPFKLLPVSQQDLRSTFNSAKNDSLIACDSEELAILIMRYLIRANKITANKTIYELDDHYSSECADPNFKILTSPVIFAIDADETKLPRKSLLVARDLVNYIDPGNNPNPFHEAKKCQDIYYDQETLFTTMMKQSGSRTNYIYRLSGLTLNNLREAIYVKTDASDLVRVNLTTWSRFFQDCLPSVFSPALDMQQRY